MIINLKTQYKAAHDIFKIPLIGPFLFFLIALFPALLCIILGEIFSFNYDNYEHGLIQLVIAAWNVLLSYIVKIKIGIFYIPCWLLFGVMGILMIFDVI